MKTFKQKTCKFSKCGKPFTPFRTTQQVCPNSTCALGFAEEKRRAKFLKDARRDQRKLRESDTRHQMKLTQPEFNKFIRERDQDEDCISCGRSNAEVELTDGWKTGGAWDCGHYLSVGSHPELRFEELNAHKQCKSCNGGSGQYTRKNHTVSEEYRPRLIDRIGQANVDWLEGPHDAKNYTAADLIEKRKYYRAKTRQLQQARAA